MCESVCARITSKRALGVIVCRAAWLHGAAGQPAIISAVIDAMTPRKLSYASLVRARATQVPSPEKSNRI